MKTLRGLGALAIALFGLNSAAQADLVITYQNHVSNGDGTFTYTYDIDIASTQTVEPGHFVTLYDVTGLIPGTITPDPVISGSDSGGFSFTVQNTGITPDDPLDLTPIIPDSALIANITFVKEDPTVVGPAGPYTFTFQSTQGLLGSLTFFAGQAITTDDGLPAENIGLTFGPAAIPEPSVTVMLGVIGILGLGCKKLTRIRKAA